MLKHALAKKLHTKRAIKSSPETQFESLLLQLHIPFEREYHFTTIQDWRFDFALPLKKIAFEIEGGVWIKGRHNRPIGFMNDCKKYLHGQLEGWKIIRIPAPWLYHTSGNKSQPYLLTYEELKEMIRELVGKD